MDSRSIKNNLILLTFLPTFLWKFYNNFKKSVIMEELKDVKKDQ